MYMLELLAVSALCLQSVFAVPHEPPTRVLGRRQDDTESLISSPTGSPGLSDGDGPPGPPGGNRPPGFERFAAFMQKCQGGSLGGLEGKKVESTTGQIENNQVEDLSTLPMESGTPLDTSNTTTPINTAVDSSETGSTTGEEDSLLEKKRRKRNQKPRDQVSHSVPHHLLKREIKKREFLEHAVGELFDELEKRTPHKGKWGKGGCPPWLSKLSMGGNMDGNQGNVPTNTGPLDADTSGPAEPPDVVEAPMASDSGTPPLPEDTGMPLVEE